MGEGENNATETILEKSTDCNNERDYKEDKDKNVNRKEVYDPTVEVTESLKTEDQEKLEKKYYRAKGKKGEWGSSLCILVYAS